MQQKKRGYMICGLAATVLLLFAAFLLVIRQLSARTVCAVLLCCLAAALILLANALRDSLKETLYTYTNIGLIGGILFTAVLSVVVCTYYIAAVQGTLTTMQEIARRLTEFPRQFSYYAVFFLTVLCVLIGVSNVSLIKHEGFCLNNALCLLIAGLYLGGTFLIYFLSDVLMEKVFVPFGLTDNRVFETLQTVIPLFLLLMLCYFECVLVGTGIMGWLAARQKPDFDKDYIIILGCSIDKRGGLLPLLKGRVNRAIRFAWEQEIATGKPLYYMPSGGQGSNEIMSEGSAMELYLKTRGAEDNEVFPERKSVNTRENFTMSKKIIDERKPDAKIAFATTNYHMLRSGIIARRAGIDAQGIAGDTKWYFWPNGFVREFFGILSLEMKTHFTVAGIMALICTAVGCLCWFGII